MRLSAWLRTVGALAVSTIPATAQPDAWPDYRGPTHDGQAPRAAEVPLRWSETENVVWKTAIPGRGWSSPVVRGTRVWMTTATEEGRRLVAVAVHPATGRIVHERVVFEVEEPGPLSKLNSHASPSPVIDEERVYVHFGTDGTACLDAESGETLWRRRDLNCTHLVGAGSSPLLVGDLLLLQFDGSDAQFVVALDKDTGETRWRRERSVDFGELPPNQRKAFSTPVLAEGAARPQLITSAAQAAYAYDPSSGEELWRVRYKGFNIASRPLTAPGMVFLNTGSNPPRLLAVRTDGEGDVTDDNVAWTCRQSVPMIPSPVAVGERLFMVNDGGIASCLDANTGETLWRHRIGGEHAASPVVASGRVYFFDREGRTVVIEPDDEYDELAVNQLASGFMASPAILGDAFLLRTTTHLYRIEER